MGLAGRCEMPANPFYKTSFWKALRAEALKRDRYRCSVPGCASTHRLTVDHIVGRPREAKGPTPQDVLGNLRVLCQEHDNALKERADGTRRGHGSFVVRGCDASGRPLDPNHPWNKG